MPLDVYFIQKTHYILVDGRGRREERNREGGGENGLPLFFLLLLTLAIEGGGGQEGRIFLYFILDFRGFRRKFIYLVGSSEQKIKFLEEIFIKFVFGSYRKGQLYEKISRFCWEVDFPIEK